MKCPFEPGYSSVEIVEAVGEGVGSPRVGEGVVTRRGHASVSAAASGVRVPEGLAPEKAVWFALAKIGFMGAMAAGHTLGGGGARDCGRSRRGAAGRGARRGRDRDD